MAKDHNGQVTNELSISQIEIATDGYLLGVAKSEHFILSTKLDAIAELLDRLVMRSEGGLEHR